MAVHTAYTVSQLTQEMRRHLEDRYSWVQVQGEISNYKKAPSGHAYFSLKDNKALLACVAWRSTVARWSGLNLEDGIEVIAGGRITVYPPRGQYQLVVSAIRPAGIGALQQRFEQLKQKLAQEGLFDAERKRPLPALPKTIAVITSAQGAALQDFLNVIHARRCPCEILVCPALVQGAEAAGQIASRIKQINQLGAADLIVLCRGGGSLEDLWAFNEEIVARAIAQSTIPIISGVGHEVDFTIADFTADRRAPTPTAAAQLIGDLFDKKRAALYLHIDRFRRTLIPRIQRKKDRLAEARRALKRYHPATQLAFYRRRLDEQSMQLIRHTRMAGRDNRRQLIENRRLMVREIRRTQYNLQSELKRRAELLRSYDPKRILKRGYAVCRKPDGPPLKDSRELAPGETVRIQLAAGGLESEVTKVFIEE